MARVVGKSAQYWSSFSPSNIPGLALWYDFSDRSTFDLSGDYVITRVRDKSGQGRHGTASNVAGANWIYDGASKGAKGLPATIAARFVFDICLSASQPLFSGAGAFTALSTGNLDIVSPTEGGGLIFRCSGGTFSVGTTSSWSDSLSNYDPMSTCVGSFSGGVQNNQYKTVTNGTYVTGSTAEINPPQVGSGLGLRIGPYTTNWNIGSYNELLLFSNALSDYDRSAVEEYLIQKWMKPYVSTITAPTDISGCTLWLDTSGGAANFTLSGSNILKWLDKSGNNYDVSTTSATFPTWQDASGYAYFAPSNIMATSAPLPPVGLETAFITGVKILNSINRTLFGAMSGSTGASRNIRTGTSGDNYGIAQTNGSAINANLLYVGTIANTTSPQVLMWQTKGTEVISKLSGQPTGYFTQWSNTTNTVGFTQIGPGAQHYREIILYNRALSASEISNVEAYLFNKWNLSNIKTFTKLPSNRVYSSTNPAIVRPLRIPYDIPNCILWLDAKDSNTIQLDPSGNVLRWLDKSGWGNDVSGGASRPNYSNETVVFNSNFMTVRNSNLSATGFRFDPPFNMRYHTFIALHKPTTATGNTGLIDFSVTGVSTSNVSFPTVDLSFATTPRGYVNASAAAALRTTSTFVENSSTTEYNIVTAAIHRYRFIIYRNGVVQRDVSGPLGSAFLFSANTSVTSIGRWGNNNTRFYEGELKELFVFDRPLAPYAVSQVETYLARKWNLTNLLPSNHIAFTAPAPVITNVSPPATLETALWVDAMTYVSEYSNNATITTNWSNRATFPTAVVPAGTPKFLTNAWQGRPGIDMTSGSFSTTFLIDASLTEVGHQTFIVASYNTGAPNTTRTALFFRPAPTTNLKHSVLQVRPLDVSLGTQFLNPNGTTVDGPYIAPPPVSAGSPFLFEIGQNSVFDVGWSVNGNTLSNTRTGMGLNGNSTGISYGWAGIGQDSGTDTTPTWNGIIHEIITFPMNRVTSTYFDNQQRFLIRAYLARKWGILNLLPTYPEKGIAV